ncbi:methylenetetrahydrofolate--tRNA-(uracil(54)-C(5))-methyltransferase (FADH(2)-oxidizing) TrmFO [Hydrogenobaculum acidophilum]
MKVNIIGAGLAGSEAAYFLAQKGIKVRLFEMRPIKTTEAHHTDKFGELVCSNTLGSFEITTGAGLLKKEMELLNSLVIKAAKLSYVKAGSALAVDRNIFSDFITNTLASHPNIEIVREEVESLDEKEINIVATGPLTSEKFSNYLKTLIKDEYLYFYDAIAPIVEASSVDFSKGFWGSRYDKGDDYFNCTMTKEEYDIFYNELLKAQKIEPKDFEKVVHFEGCLPIEEIAQRGYETLVFGPMSPKGLKHHISKDVYAIVQLRKETKEGEALSLVGFQTKLTYKEQLRVFRLIPCLKNAIFSRLGSMHRNTFLQSNKALKPTLELKENQNILFAGQITGVEGYSASSATGIMAGINAWRKLTGKSPIIPPKTTMLGALLHYISLKEGELQPMNPVFGLLPEIEAPKKYKKLLKAYRALFDMARFIEENSILT